jgi:hypothetical protein
MCNKPFLYWWERFGMGALPPGIERITPQPMKNLGWNNIYERKPGNAMWKFFCCVSTKALGGLSSANSG